MQEYALELVRNGVTTFEEVRRVMAFEKTSAEACGSCARELSPNFVFCPFCGIKRNGTHAQAPEKAAGKRKRRQLKEAVSAWKTGGRAVQPAGLQRPGHHGFLRRKR